MNIVKQLTALRRLPLYVAVVLPLAGWAEPWVLLQGSASVSAEALPQHDGGKLLWRIPNGRSRD